MPYQRHEVFDPPGPNASLLRYMNFVKFVSLIDRNALHFARVDHLGDKFEGSMSKANLRAREALDPRSIDAGRPELLAGWDGMRRWLPKQTFVNCWTLSGYESVAMWRLYVGEGNGVAIQSTFRRLANAMADYTPPVFIGKVKYIDFERDFVPEENGLFPFVRKRRSFAYERELRALTSHLFSRHTTEEQREVPVPDAPDALSIPVDLERLIVRVRVSPVSPLWFTELVDSVLRRYGLRIPVSQSDIDGEPVY